jgi:hypothetical protein
MPNNDFTATNLAASDVVLDTPTDNFCTFNPLNAYSAIVGMLAEGNLRVTTATGASGYQMMSTMGVSSGKWYYEYRDDSPSTRNTGIGWVDSKQTPTGSGAGAINQNGAIFYNNIIYKNGGYDSAGDTLDNGDICGVALDADAGKIWFSINGTWWDSQDPAAGSNAKYTASTNSDIWVPSFMDGNYGQGTVNYGQDGTFAGAVTAQGNADGNGRGDFYYTPPTGFLALSTGNLATPTIAKPSENFNALTYASSGAKTGVGFQPDLVWVKARGNTYNHELTDSVRGVTKALSSNDSEAESTDSTGLTAFGTDGFTVGAGTNYSTSSMVAWSWKAGTSFEAVSGVSGSGSKNVDAGFSIVTWTGNDDGTGASPTPQSVSHGLTVTPELIIAKSRTQNTFHNFDWIVWHKDLTSGNYLLLNGNGAETGWGDALVSSIDDSSVSFGSDAMMSGEDLNAGSAWASADDYVAYLFASVEGFSKVGSYTGNGLADGAFVYCGFRPAYILIKALAGYSWYLFDSKTATYNVVSNFLQADQNYAEQTYTSLDITSNGFKFRATGVGLNGSASYIFYAVAESPLKYANAR